MMICLQTNRYAAERNAKYDECERIVRQEN